MSTFLKINNKSILSGDFLLGSIYRLHRKDKKITLQYISAQTGLTVKKLSDFEKGRTKLKLDTIVILYQCLGIRYQCVEEDKKEFGIRFYSFYEAILNYDDNIDEVYENAYKLKEAVQTTNLYPQFLLMELIYHIFNNDMFYNYEKIIESIHVQYLDNKQKVIYHDCIALYLMGQKRYHEALKHFEKATEYGYSQATAIVNYHKGLLYIEMNDPCKAMTCVLKAKFFFDNNHYVKRAVLSNFRIACIYRHLNCYDEAIQIYSNCILQMKSYGMVNKYKTIYEQYLWCLILAKEYNKVIKVIDQLEIKIKDETIFYLFYSLANMKLGKHNLAMRSIAEAKKLLKNNSQAPLLKSIVDTFYTYLSKNKKQETKLNKLKTALDESIKSNNTELQRYIIEMILDILDPITQADIIIEYYKMILKSYKFQ